MFFSDPKGISTSFSIRVRYLYELPARKSHLHVRDQTPSCRILLTKYGRNLQNLFRDHLSIKLPPNSRYLGINDHISLAFLECRDFAQEPHSP